MNSQDAEEAEAIRVNQARMILNLQENIRAGLKFEGAKFVKPKKTAKSAQSQSASLIPVRNKFESISVPEESKPNEQPTKEKDTNNQLTTTKFRVPPIFLADGNIKELTSKIAELGLEDYDAKVFGKRIRIRLSTPDDYRALTRFFDSNNWQYHTFQNQVNHLSVVIKDIPTSLSIEDIENELIDKAIPVIRLHRLFNRSKEPLPICALTTKDDDDGKQIFSLKSIYH
ncbi:unnamed protein product, partial [Allacma fusca]